MPKKLILGWLPWIFAAGLLVALLIHTVANPDIFYHLADGRNLLLHGLGAQPDHVISVVNFIDGYWLFQIACFKIMSGAGIAGLTVFFGLSWLAIFTGWLKVSQLKLTRPLAMVIFVAAVIVCQVRFQERPEIFSFLFLIIDLMILLKPSLKLSDLALLILVQILWCNTHGYFILGPAVAGLWSLSRISKSPRSLWSLGVPAFLIFASMISPFGWRNWLIVYDQWKFLGATAEMVNETKATFSYGFSLWNLDVFWCVWIFVAVLATALGRRLFADRKKLTREKSMLIFAFFLAVSGLILGATVARNIPLTILMAAPLFAIYVDALGKVSAKVPAPLFTMALPLALSVWVLNQGFYKSLVHPYRFGVGVSEFAFPLQFETFLTDHPPVADARWFSDGNWGSFLEFHHPDLFLYGDSRYAGENVEEFFAATETPGMFFALNERRKFDGAVFDIGRSLGVVMILLKDPRWRLAYRDLSTAYFINVEKNPGANRTGAGLAGDLYSGQDLSERVYGNNAIQWTEAMVGTDNLEGLMQVLDQFDHAKEIPSPILVAGLLYLKIRPDGPLTAKLFALRSKMLALDERDAVDIDNKLAAVKAGTYWN